MLPQVVTRLRDLSSRFGSSPLRTARLAWAKLWISLAGRWVPLAWGSWLAGLSVPPYYGRHRLAGLHPRGYTAPTAKLHHPTFRRGRHTSIADRVVVYRDVGGGPVTIGERSTVNQDTILQTGQGGAVEIGEQTHIQPRCQFSAYVGSIRVGDGVSIGPGCAFYPYDHQMAAGSPIREQGFASRGDIVIESDVWIGTGVIILADVRIGAGAVIGAGSVVTRDVPAMAIAVGVPARVVAERS
jgi:acetyltransferase-like isoleucine patch superfamily enzyme